jgi:hypothetical protein
MQESRGAQIFRPSEMELLLCGERRIEWDKDSLQQHIKLVSNEQGLSVPPSATYQSRKQVREQQL